MLGWLTVSQTYFAGHAGQTAARFAAEVYPNSLKEMLETASHDDQSILGTMKECFVKVLFSTDLTSLGRLVCYNIFFFVFHMLLNSYECTYFFSVRWLTYAFEVNEKFANHIKGNQAAFRTCGTTCLVCFVKGDKIYVANLGDTRAVLNRDGQAMRISADHKPADLAEEDRIRYLCKMMEYSQHIRSYRVSECSLALVPLFSLVLCQKFTYRRAHGGFVMIRGITARVNGTLGVARALGDHYLNPYITDEAFVDVVTMESTDKVCLFCGFRIEKSGYLVMVEIPVYHEAYRCVITRQSGMRARVSV